MSIQSSREAAAKQAVHLAEKIGILLTSQQQSDYAELRLRLPGNCPSRCDLCPVQYCTLPDDKLLEKIL